MGRNELTDNECYLLAKQKLFEYECLGDLTVSQLSEVIQLAQRIKVRGAAILEASKEHYE